MKEVRVGVVDFAVKSLSAPLLHLNGSGYENLYEQLSQAVVAVGNAIDGVARTVPHMRDYYPLGDAEKAFARACEEHLARLDRLQAVRDELNAVLRSVDEQEHDRRRVRGAS